MNTYKTLLTIAGYIPVIGTIVAVVKFYFIYILEKNTALPVRQVIVPLLQSYLNGQKLRTALEITSLGVFLLVPDLIFTLMRRREETTPVPLVSLAAAVSSF